MAATELLSLIGNLKPSAICRLPSLGIGRYSDLVYRTNVLRFGFHMSL
jgi:hypothetical protein